MHLLFKKMLKMFRAHRFRSIAVVTLSAVMVAALTGITYATNVVYIYDGDSMTKYYTTDPTLSAEEILEEQGIALTADDEIVYHGFTDDSNVTSLMIRRAFEVDITADGSTKTVRMASGTVADALEKAQVSLNDEDLINVSPQEEVTSGMDIVVNRVTYNTVTETTSIPFEVQVNETAAMSKDKTIVTRVGQEGEQVATFRQTLIDGVVSQTDLIETTVTREPVTQVVTQGTSSKAIASELLPPADLIVDSNGVPANYSRVLTGKATAYSSSRSVPRGASGMALNQGHVAVNPNIIPYGSKLFITSADGRYVYGYAIAADTGTALMDGRVLVDCFFNSYEASCRFGAKTVNVYVLS